MPRINRVGLRGRVARGCAGPDTAVGPLQPGGPTGGGDQLRRRQGAPDHPSSADDPCPDPAAAHPHGSRNVVRGGDQFAAPTVGDGAAGSVRRRAARQAAIGSNGGEWSHGRVANAGVAAEPAELTRRAPLAALGAGRVVQRPEVEGEHVAWFEVERRSRARDDRVDVGHELEAVVGVGVGDGVDEAPRHEPPPPAVRAGDELHPGRRRHRVERHPQADVLVAVDAVVRLVVVPRRHLAGPGLLHEDVLVEEADRRRPARRATSASGPRARPPVPGDALPVDVVAEEPPGPPAGV